jgi:DNA polymerase
MYPNKEEAMDKIRKLSIDLETYSPEDLAKCGVYKYAENPAFGILLFGVSANDGPVIVYDIACGEEPPDEILEALTNNSVEKWAYNASFERVCLSVWLRRHHPGFFKGYGAPDDAVRGYLDPTGWKCSRIWGAYNGLPLSLEKIGTVLGFEQQKLKEGKDLIRYFCSPCKPTKVNGGRTRNLPADAPDKWELFKKYNQRDVEVEMQIQQRLKNYPVPDFVWDEYHIDQTINDRGILCDTEVVGNAIKIDALTKADLMQQLQRLTGLENPNSVAQMKDWLSRTGVEMESLGKKEVAALLKEDIPEHVKQVLRLRQMLAKSSVKKYQAMQTAMCSDHRCRGMFQFYGANRSGRFAGRIVQLQNLPQNHLPDLEEARDLVRAGNYAALDLLYDSVPQVLSELIRTAFIPKPGMKFVVSDYSSIEARVLAYLAGETHTIESFARGEDLYCATASAMFHKPVVKHGINGELRQKGKIATLACIAEGQLVLTNHGLIPIERVTTDDLVWDGEQFVHHDGVVCRGVKEVITYEGLTATKDHLVWVSGEPWPVRFGDAAACGSHLVKTGNGRTPVRLGEDNLPGETLVREMEPLLRADAVHGVRINPVAESEQPDYREVKWLSALLATSADPSLARSETDGCQAALHESKRPGICQLWWAWDFLLLLFYPGSWPVSHRYFRPSGQGSADRSDQYKRELRKGEYPLCFSVGEQPEQTLDRTDEIRADLLALLLSGRDPETVLRRNTGRDHSGRGNSCVRETEELEEHPRTARVYDIRNAGRYHRFTVSGCLVHNCGYGGSVGALKAMGALDMGLTEDELQPIVTAWREANPHIVKYWWDIDAAVMKAVKLHLPSQVGAISIYYQSGMLFIKLPSGRRLSYVQPRIGQNQYGNDCVTYMGIDQQHWERIESYGPKFVENIVQGVARDILCFAMKNLRDRFIVGHVHDELIIEVPMDASMQEICDIMGQTPDWMPGMLLRADGYECRFYQKD